VFEGTPADLVAARSTLTGEHLAEFMGSQPSLAGPSRALAGKPSLSKAVRSGDLRAGSRTPQKC
jgi:hypothetical protein